MPERMEELALACVSIANTILISVFEQWLMKGDRMASFFSANCFAGDLRCCT